MRRPSYPEEPDRRPPIAEPDPEAELDYELRAATASPKSLWAQHSDADFFLPPALSTDWLDYLDLGEPNPIVALHHRFGIETKGK